MIDVQTNYKDASNQPLALNITRLAQKKIENQNRRAVEHNLEVIEPQYFLNDDGASSWFDDMIEDIILTTFNQKVYGAYPSNETKSTSQDFSSHTEDNKTTEENNIMNVIFNEVANEVNNGDSSWIVTFRSDQIDDAEKVEKSEPIEKFYVTRMKFWRQVNFEHEAKHEIKTRLCKGIESLEQGEILSHEQNFGANQDL